MPDYHVHQDFHDHAAEHGLAVPIPPQLRDEILAAGLALPTTRTNIGIATPPHVGDGGDPRCAHCGEPVEEQTNLARHAVAGFEHTDLRLLVRHCADCVGSDHCRPDVTTPGSGHPFGPAGFCEPVEG